MKKRNPLLLVFALVAAASLFMNVQQMLNGRDTGDRSESIAENTVNGQARVIERYFTRDSVEHTVIREVAAKTTAEKQQAVGKGYLDTLTRALGVAVNRIEEVTQVNAELRAELAMRPVEGTTRRAHRDKWLDAEYDTATDSLRLAYNVSLNNAKLWKRSWLFAPKQYRLDLWSDDPRVSIAGAKRFSAPETRQKRIGIGGQAGYGVVRKADGTLALAPFAGVGVNLNFIEF